jgi:hypothetical protein
LKTLVGTTDEAKLLISWLQEGVFDALEKKYVSFSLKSLLTFQKQNKIET